MIRPRYIIVQDSSPRLGRFARALLYVAMFLLGLTYFLGFFWYGTEPLDSEIRTEGR